jgi:serine/threonine-protein kinase HipA
MIDINVCPSTLKEGFSTFSPYAKKHFLGGRTVSHILPYESLSSGPGLMENKGHLSLSGAQEKYSAVIDHGKFRLTNENERGTYILKPKLTGFENREYSPANENLTMQIAAQVYGIETAENAVCFTGNSEQVYVTRRFDIRADGSRLQQEDLASLAGITKQTHGGNYKYDALDYVDLGSLIRKYIPAWPVELVRYFDLILFNFVFANGDAHVKNFSVIQTSRGDYRLAPAYDLINTLFHIPGGTIFALNKGLYPGWNPEFGVSGADFLEFGKRIGLDHATAKKEIDRFCDDYPETDRLIQNSFLSEELKKEYRLIYRTRINSFLKH